MGGRVVAELLGAFKFASEVFALGGRYGKTEAQHLVISLQLTFWKITNRRKHCQLLTHRQPDCLFQRSLFLEIYSC